MQIAWPTVTARASGEITRISIQLADDPTPRSRRKGAPVRQRLRLSVFYANSGIDSQLLRWNLQRRRQVQQDEQRWCSLSALKEVRKRVVHVAGSRRQSQA